MASKFGTHNGLSIYKRLDLVSCLISTTSTKIYGAFRFHVCYDLFNVNVEEDNTFLLVDIVDIEEPLWDSDESGPEGSNMKHDSDSFKNIEANCVLETQLEVRTHPEKKNKGHFILSRDVNGPTLSLSANTILKPDIVNRNMILRKYIDNNFDAASLDESEATW